VRCFGRWPEASQSPWPPTSSISTVCRRILMQRGSQPKSASNPPPKRASSFQAYRQPKLLQETGRLPTSLMSVTLPYKVLPRSQPNRPSDSFVVTYRQNRWHFSSFLPHLGFYGWAVRPVWKNMPSWLANAPTYTRKTFKPHSLRSQPHERKLLCPHKISQDPAAILPREKPSFKLGIWSPPLRARLLASWPINSLPASPGNLAQATSRQPKLFSCRVLTIRVSAQRPEV